MKNVIVTGANGFIGNSLIKKLIENNVERYSKKLEANRKEHNVSTSHCCHITHGNPRL